jgi:hypothetical protein
MDNQFTLTSGAKLVVTIAPFQDANNLKNSLLRAVKGMRGLDETIVGAAQGIKDVDLGSILDVVLNAATSPEVENAIFKCAERVTWNAIKVTPELFDDIKYGEQAREDYYEICLKISEVNCRPFLKGVGSLFKGYLQRNTKSPEQK